MTDTKFTPGPWTFNASEKWPFGMSIEPNITRIDRIASSTAQNTLDDLRSAVGFKPHEQEEIVDMIKTQEANAHLIAAAPDLYEALEDVADLYQNTSDENSIALKIRNALAKARGDHSSSG
jgi:hypothetical protein